MLSKTKLPISENFYRNDHLHQIRKRFTADSPQHQFQFRLAIIALLACFVLLMILPLSSGTAFALEWTSSDQPGTGILETSSIYLPLAVKNYPVILQPPVLNLIDNPDGDGSYTVSWSEVEGTASYLLEEDDNAGFSSPSTAYEGSGTTQAISGKGAGTYYYRVKATNSGASSGWSNVESVVVSVIPPACPQNGSWRGITSQTGSINFIVEDSPECQIVAGSLKISFSTPLCGSATSTFLSAIPITDDQFSVSSYTVDASGEFTALDLAVGTLTVDFWSGNNYCHYSGSWEASPVVGANGPILSILVQPNDMILVGGDFSEVGRQAHHNLARLNPDGSLDAAFAPDFNDTVRALALQPDGKILAIGVFSQVNGAAHAGIARLNPDGSLDTDFNTQIDGDGSVLALQSDGKILIGGWFSAVNEQPRKSFARLNSDGTLDETFNVTSSYMDVYALKVLSGDNILLGGYIEDVTGVAWADYFVRLSPDGTLDTSFQPDTGGYWVDEFAVQGDDKIIAAIFGDLARFNTNGTRDTSFNSPKPVGGSIRYLDIQTGNALVVGGDFIDLGDGAFDYLAQLDMNGALNPGFNPAPNAKVYALAVQPDNKILVGGAFTQIDGQVRHSIMRLNADGSLDLTFSLLP
jgi:uncharacterized delta-60 repeat protein